nr:sensor domain-containing diguanylate cyclase [uncultured Sphaerochaeta sp.]
MRGDSLAAKCKALVENLPDGVCFSDPQGSLFYGNKSFAQLFCFRDTEEILNASLLSYIHPDDRPTVEEFLGRMMQSEYGKTVVQVRTPGCDSHEQWIEIRAVNTITEEGAFLVVRDVTSYKTLQEELLFQALTDELTGLYNRRGFKMMAEQELRHSQRLETEVMMLSVDIDSFKVINDTFGHGEGDRVLRLVAKTLRASFRSTDIIARWGGDEFLVLALDAPSGTVDILTDRFKQSLVDISRANALPFTIEVTIGSASRENTMIIGLEQLVQQADRAMYACKRR